MILKALYAGLGSISDSWLSYLVTRDDVEIAGLIDLNQETALKKKEKYNLSCPVFSDIETALSNGSFDVLIDNIVPSGRLELAEKALSNGLHVLSEKPLASSMKEGLEINRLSRKYDRNFFVMQNRRYNTNMFTFRNAIINGSAGKTGYLSAEFMLGPHFGGFREEMESPLLIDMAIHTFDQARFLLNCNPVSVYCHEYNPAGSWYKGNASAVCVFEFENNIVFSYQGSWCANGFNTSWDSSWRAIAENGSILWDGTNLPVSDIPVEKIICDFNGHKGCINEMITCLHENRMASTSSFDNIYSLAMVFASIKSSKENKKIYIKELLED
ncbi:MAG: Gfo/Idh/MocA family oxidoreductase [Clostridia bacterium]|nr:Gfo/Idh/MocA family oxidoreductase [Clostridia bacterium]